MTVSFGGVSAPGLFRNSLYKMRVYGVPEESRNGPVYVIDQPVVFSLWNPIKRVLTDPIRNANPFFHVMEFVWMMAGSNDIQWIAHFNKQMLAYSDDGETQHAAYGHRWRRHFTVDQVKKAIVMLGKNRNDRRVVISMWDSRTDLGHADLSTRTEQHVRHDRHQPQQ
jgi:thymidylate synthase